MGHESASQPLSRGVTWLSGWSSRTYIICINLIIYSFDHFTITCGPDSSPEARTILEWSPPTLGATLPRTVPKADLEPWCVGPISSPCSYCSGQTVEFSPAHEGWDWQFLRLALYDFSYFICLVMDRFRERSIHRIEICQSASVLIIWGNARCQ